MAVTKKNVNKDVSEATDSAAYNASTLNMKPSDASPKVVTMAALMDIFQQLSKEDALNLLNATLSQIGHEADMIPGGAAAQNQASVAMKPSAAVGNMGEAIKEDIAALFGNDATITEDFKDKATVLFEAALSVREKLIREEIQAEFTKKEEELSESYEEVVSESISELTEVVDKYVSYVAEQWVKENQVAIDTSLNAEINEDFIETFHSIFKEKYGFVPEEKRDFVAELTEKLDAVTDQLNTVLKENIELKESKVSDERDEIFDELTEGMTLLQKEQLRVLTEGVEANTDEDFRKKVQILKESNFRPSTKRGKTGILAEHLTGVDDNNVDEDKKKVPFEMRGYVDVISAVAKK